MISINYIILFLSFKIFNKLGRYKLRVNVLQPLKKDKITLIFKLTYFYTNLIQTDLTKSEIAKVLQFCLPL